MRMGTRQDPQQQEDLWIANVDSARSPGHPFCQRLNELLDGEKFDEFVEGLCRKSYAPRMRRPSLAPGIYFRALLIGYFEGHLMEALKAPAADRAAARHGNLSTNELVRRKTLLTRSAKREWPRKQGQRTVC
jgi:hypothetical protein